MKFIKEHFRPLFFVLALATLLLGAVMQSDRVLLQSKSAPYGILNIQLSHSVKADTAIRNEWAKDSLTKIVYADTVSRKTLYGSAFAIDQTHDDFWFIGLYFLLISLLLLKFHTWKKVSVWVLISAVFFAGLMNALADSQLLNVLQKRPFYIDLIFYPSIIKWAILVIVSIYIIVLLIIKGLLVKISKDLQFVIRHFFEFRIVCIGLLVVFVFLSVDQGQDLLLVLNASYGGPLVFLLAVTSLALLNWYLPKLYDQNFKEKKLKEVVKKDLRFESEKGNQDTKAKLARMLGVLTFLIPSVCIFQAMRTFHIAYPLDMVNPIIWLVLMVTFYYLAAKKNRLKSVYDFNKKSGVVLFWITLFVIAAFLLLGPVVTPKEQNAFTLTYLGFEPVLLSFAFFLVTTMRREPKTGLLLVLSARSVVPFVFVPGIAAGLAFLYANLWPMQVAFNENGRFLTLPVVFSAIIFYMLLFSYLLLLGRKWSIQLVSLVFILGLCFAITVNNSFHRVRMLKTTARKYSDLESYTHNWLENRKAEIIAFHKHYPTASYPVYIVNTYGGGIRATYWTVIAVGETDRQLKHNDTINQVVDLSHDFQHYVFAYSGVSGGTIGASVLCAARFNDLSSNSHKVNLEKDPVTFFKNDFLTPVVVGLLGSDVWGAFTGSSLWPDRGALQERTWEKHGKAAGFSYNASFGAYWSNKKYEVPLLFSNSFDIDSGRKGIVAPLKLIRKDFPGIVLVDPLIKDPTDEMRLSTASFLSARFPFVSPSGKIGDQHFADGGNVENSGAETALEIQVVFSRVLDSLRSGPDGASYTNVRIHLLSLSNSLHIQNASSIENTKNLFELTAPLTGVLNLIDGNAGKADSVNRILSQSDKKFAYHLIAPTIPKHSYHGGWPVYPLGWQMSEDALNQMRLTLRGDDSVKKVIQSLRPICTNK